MASRTSKGKIVLIIANVLLILGLAGTTVYFYTKYQDEKRQQSLTTEEKNKLLVEEINKVYDLPDEEPVVAIVTSPEEFKSQYPVFDNAQAGDYLLFFRKNRLNVLYRQDEKRVVKTANVIVPITVELVGTQSAIDAAEGRLKDFGNQITVVKTVKEGISQAFVFDIDNDQKAETEQIADVLGYDIGSTLPSSITPTEQSEIVIAVTTENLSPAAQSSEQTTLP